MRRLLLALAVPVLLAACGGGGGGTTQTTTTTTTSSGPSQADLALYDYNRNAPLGFKDNGPINRNYPVVVKDISYTSPRGGQVTAYMATPKTVGRLPGVIFLHGSGGSRRDLAVMATWLAGRGAVTLAIDSPYARLKTAPNLSGVAGIRRLRDLDVQTVVDLRRGIDLLQAQPEVDDSRIGFLGYSAGAKSGAILVGVDPRVKAAVLVSGGAPPLEKVVSLAPANLRNQLRTVMEAADPPRFVGRTHAALLLQIGKKDNVVPQADLNALVKAAGHPEVKRYNAGHGLVEDRQAIADALAFLDAKLRIASPVPGALTGPH